MALLDATAKVPDHVNAMSVVVDGGRVGRHENIIYGSHDQVGRILEIKQRRDIGGTEHLAKSKLVPKPVA